MKARFVVFFLLALVALAAVAEADNEDAILEQPANDKIAIPNVPARGSTSATSSSTSTVKPNGTTASGATATTKGSSKTKSAAVVPLLGVSAAVVIALTQMV